MLHSLTSVRTLCARAATVPVFLDRHSVSWFSFSSWHWFWPFALMHSMLQVHVHFGSAMASVAPHAVFHIVLFTGAQSSHVMRTIVFNCGVANQVRRAYLETFIPNGKICIVNSSSKIQFQLIFQQRQTKSDEFSIIVAVKCQYKFECVSLRYAPLRVGISTYIAADIASIAPSSIFIAILI